MQSRLGQSGSSALATGVVSGDLAHFPAFPYFFPASDKDIILRQLYQHLEQHPPATTQEGYLRMRALIEEHLYISTRYHRPGDHQ